MRLKILIMLLMASQSMFGQGATLGRTIDLNKAAQNKPFDQQKYQQIKSECLRNAELVMQQLQVRQRTNSGVKPTRKLHGVDVNKVISDQTKAILDQYRWSHPIEVHKIYNELASGGRRLIID